VSHRIVVRAPVPALQAALIHRFHRHHRPGATFTDAAASSRASAETRLAGRPHATT
jgi:hypothetical protein